LGEVNGWCTAVQPVVPSSSLDLLEHGRIHDPDERPRRLVDQSEPRGDLSRAAAEQRPGVAGLARGEEDAVSGLGADRRGQPVALGLARCSSPPGPPSVPSSPTVT
jgi:hypothetical protein